MRIFQAIAILGCVIGVPLMVHHFHPDMSLACTYPAAILGAGIGYLAWLRHPAFKEE